MEEKDEEYLSPPQTPPDSFVVSWDSFTIESIDDGIEEKILLPSTENQDDLDSDVKPLVRCPEILEEAKDPVGEKIKWDIDQKNPKIEYKVTDNDDKWIETKDPIFSSAQEQLIPSSEPVETKHCIPDFGPTNQDSLVNGKRTTYFVRPFSNMPTTV